MKQSRSLTRKDKKRKSAKIFTGKLLIESKIQQIQQIDVNEETLKEFPKITNIAVRLKEDYSVIHSMPIGYEHANILRDEGLFDNEVDFGFLDESGEFLNRGIAMHHAKIHGQVLEKYLDRDLLCSFMLKF